MAFVGKWMMLVAVVALFGSQVEVDARDIEELCRELDHQIEKRTELETELETGSDMASFGKKWLKAHTSSLSSKRNLIAAWENIFEKDECSQSSWDDLEYVNYCLSFVNFDEIKEPVKVYTEKCLTPEYVNKLVKSKAGNSHAKKVDFVDDAFIKKFHDDNPDDLPLHVDLVRNLMFEAKGNELRNCCVAKKSIGAVFDAIERDFAKQGKKPEDVLHAQPEAVADYLEKKLFKPCKEVREYYGELADQFETVTMRYTGKQTALIKLLDQESKDILFRYKYCQMLRQDRDFVEKKVAQHYDA